MYGCLGTSQPSKKLLPAWYEAGGGGQEEPLPDLSRHSGRGQRSGDFHHVWRLARRLRLLVPLRLQRHLPRRLVCSDETQLTAARKLLWVLLCHVFSCRASCGTSLLEMFHFICCVVVWIFLQVSTLLYDLIFIFINCTCVLCENLIKHLISKVIMLYVP